MAYVPPLTALLLPVFLPLFFFWGFVIMANKVLYFLKSENGPSAASYAAILAAIALGYVMACQFLLG